METEKSQNQPSLFMQYKKNALDNQRISRLMKKKFIVFLA